MIYRRNRNSANDLPSAQDRARQRFGPDGAAWIRQVVTHAGRTVFLYCIGTEFRAHRTLLAESQVGFSDAFNRYASCDMTRASALLADTMPNRFSNDPDRLRYRSLRRLREQEILLAEQMQQEVETTAASRAEDEYADSTL